MLRRDEWRRLPQDPQSPLAWWWRESRPAITLLLASAVLVAVMAVLWLRESALFVGLMAVGTFAVAVGAYRLLSAFATPRLLALAPSPAPVEAFPVEYTLYFGDVCTGRDQGVASFVDGWLHVEGLHASFSLRPIDTARVGFSARGFDQFDLPGGQRIEMRPLAASASDRDTFQETVRVWHRFTVAPPLGEPLLPPLRVHPSAASRSLSTLLVHAFFLVPVVAAFALFSRWGATGSFLPYLVAPSAFLFRAAAGAVRDLCRLKNFERKTLGTGEAPPSVYDALS